MDEVHMEYLNAFTKITEQSGGAAIPFTPRFQEFMLAVSCRVFVGN